MSTYLSHEQDPASDRLSPNDVVEIHRLHRAGTPWDEIAKQFGTHRFQIRRVVKGERWKTMHPTVRPDLYSDGASEAPVANTYTKEQVDAAFRAAYREFFAALER